MQERNGAYVKLNSAKVKRISQFYQKVTAEAGGLTLTALMNF